LNSIYSQRSWRPDGAAPAEATGTTEVIDLERLMAAGRRQWKVIALVAANFLALACVYVLLAQPLYTAQTAVLIDEQRSQLLSEISAVATGLQTDAHILTEIEIIHSRTLAEQVADKLDLKNRLDFLTAWQPLSDRARALFGEAPDRTAAVAQLSEADRQQFAVYLLRAGVSSARIERSFVVAIGYTSPNPVLSAEIAQGYAEAYLTSQLDANFEATQRASEWLQGRTEELRVSSVAADEAVQTFRRENNLVSADGTLMSEQQLVELNSQLSLARSETANAQARFTELQRLLDGEDPTAVFRWTPPRDTGSAALADLQQQYGAAQERQRTLEAQWGPDHPQAIAVRAEMERIGGLLLGEFRRLLGSYENEFRIAESNEASIRVSIAEAIGDNNADNANMSELRDLQQQAESYRLLYQSFLDNYQAVLQQQSYPVNSARIVSAADVPTGASAPRKRITIAFGLVLGLLAGAGFAFFREFRERFFRTGDEVRSLGVEFLGYLPAEKAGNKLTKTTIGVPKGDVPVFVPAISRVVLDNPLSAYAETLRNVQLASSAIISSKCRVIGITSLFPGEGKSVVASNLAHLLSRDDKRTLLVDGDLRSPGLTRMLAPGTRAGIADLAEHPEYLGDLVTTMPGGAASFLPADPRQRTPHSAQVLRKSVGSFLAAAREVYDYVIIDLPPIGPVIDARALAPDLDGVLLIVQWGKTPRRAVRAALNNSPGFKSQVIGAVLNRVNYGKLRLYDDASVESYSERYGGYIEN
jgi:succinoglycan biosynthesis transport protein ExoP